LGGAAKGHVVGPQTTRFLEQALALNRIGAVERLDAKGRDRPLRAAPPNAAGRSPRIGTSLSAIAI